MQEAYSMRSPVARASPAVEGLAAWMFVGREPPAGAAGTDEAVVADVPISATLGGCEVPPRDATSRTTVASPVASTTPRITP
jgi:hypothetical protein